MSSLDEVANQFRRDVLARDEQALRAVQGAYAVAKISINGALNSVTDAITERRSSGQPVSRAWLLRQQSLTALLQTVEIEMAGLGAYAAAQTMANQAIVTTMGVEHARQLAVEAIGEGPPGVTLPWAQLPAGALENLIGVLEDGTALSEHLSQHGPAAAGEVRDALVSGIALGEGIRPLTKRVGAALDQRADDVLTFVRTTTLNSYRQASLQSYRANVDVVQGWVWHSARSRTTCAYCWSNHGRVFDLDTPFVGHSRCRCAALPLTRSWQSLGYDVPDDRTRIPRGVDLFDDLDPADQRKILGPAKMAAFEDGFLKLADLRGTVTVPGFGKFGFERSLTDVIGAEKAREYIAKARAAA